MNQNRFPTGILNVDWTQYFYTGASVDAAQISAAARQTSKAQLVSN
jgi:hypothetical protein